MREWARKKDDILALLSAEYATRQEAPNVGTQSFWRGWAADYLTALINPISEAVGIGARDAIDDMSSQLAIDVDWTLVNADAASWARNYAAELAESLTETDRLNVREAVGRFIESQDDFEVLVDDINSIVGNIERARLIAVTESTRSYAEGNQIAWQESGAIDGKRWNTANDERVCPICEPRADTVVGLSASFDGIDNPPAHPNCRCWITPEVSL